MTPGYPPLQIRYWLEKKVKKLLKLYIYNRTLVICLIIRTVIIILISARYVFEFIAFVQGTGRKFEKGHIFVFPIQVTRCEFNEPTNFHVALKQWISVDLKVRPDSEIKIKIISKNVLTVIRVMKRLRLIFVYQT